MLKKAYIQTQTTFPEKKNFPKKAKCKISLNMLYRQGKSLHQSRYLWTIVKMFTPRYLRFILFYRILL